MLRSRCDGFGDDPAVRPRSVVTKLTVVCAHAIDQAKAPTA